MTDYEDFIRTEVPERFDELVAAAVPFVGAETEACSELAIALGESKFCGQPDLPPDFDWPMSSDGPCHFVGQLNLATLSSFETMRRLPEHGLLSFFYHDPGGTPAGADSIVLYFDDPQTLVRTPVVTDTRWGERFHQDHQFSRRFLFSQCYAIDTDDFKHDDARELVDHFNDTFADSHHQFFGIPRYSWENVGSRMILGSFGDWSDRLIFSLSLIHISEPTRPY